MKEKIIKDKKNFWIMTVFLILLIGSVAASFVRYYILKDFQILAQTSCDPASEICFQIECDSDLEENCNLTEDGQSVSYYKYIYKNASTIYQCEKTEEKLGCNEELSCVEGENDCSYEYCSEENLQEGEVCTVLNN